MAMDIRSAVCASALLTVVLAGCPKDDKSGGDAPPATNAPPPTTNAAGSPPGANTNVCANPGEVKDKDSAELFPRTTAGYCVDPKGETRAFGANAKLNLDDVCTTGMDGECEVYKSYGLKRHVRFSYIDGSGGPAQVEIALSEFGDMLGAYGMYTKRVVAQDPLDKTAPRVLLAKAQGALGTGRGYVWRGKYLLEMQYNNDKEKPEQLSKSSAKVLTEMGKDIGDRLPGDLKKPRAVEALPGDFLVPNGVELVKQPYGLACGQGALGYYKQVDRRHRIVTLAGEGSPMSVADCMKAIEKKPGAMPIKELKDNEGTLVVLQASADAPKLEFVFARKGDVVYGVGDEEYLLIGKSADDQAKGRVGKDAAIARMKDVLAQADAKKPADAGAPGTKATAVATATAAAPTH